MGRSSGTQVASSFYRSGQRFGDQPRAFKYAVLLVVLLVVVGVPLGVRAAVVHVKESHYLQYGGRDFPAGTSRSDKLEAGYAACDWLKTQTPGAFDTGRSFELPYQTAIRIYSQSDSDLHDAGKDAILSAWHQLCRSTEQDHFPELSGDQ